MSKSYKIAYLGPEGSFTEQALRSQEDLASSVFVPYPRFIDVLDATSSGAVDLGFVAIENAIEGTVNITLDSLAFDHELYIQREVEISIKIQLLALPGVKRSDLREVHSYPVATAQCRKFLESELPEVQTKPTTSTSAAAKVASQNPSFGALAPLLAAEKYGLEVVASNVADHEDNTTRFVLVGCDSIPKATGNDKTTVVLSQRADSPGSLISILQEFAARGINLTRLTSRPVKTTLGQYCFIVDFEGHISEKVVAECLKSVQARYAQVKVLGSYPSCSVSEQRRIRTEDSLDSAERWMCDLLNRVEQ